MLGQFALMRNPVIFGPAVVTSLVTVQNNFIPLFTPFTKGKLCLFFPKFPFPNFVAYKEFFLIKIEMGLCRTCIYVTAIEKFNNF